MKILNISLTIIYLIMLTNCSSLEWTDQEFLDAFAKDCNPQKTEPYKRYCNCQIEQLKAKYPKRSDFAALSESDSDKVIKDARAQCINWDMAEIKENYIKECNSDGEQQALCTCQYNKLSRTFPKTTQFIQLPEEEQIAQEKEMQMSCMTWDVMGSDLKDKLLEDENTASIAECLVEHLKKKYPSFEAFAESQEDDMEGMLVLCLAEQKQREDAANAQEPPEEHASEESTEE